MAYGNTVPLFLFFVTPILIIPNDAIGFNGNDEPTEPTCEPANDAWSKDLFLNLIIRRMTEFSRAWLCLVLARFVLETLSRRPCSMRRCAAPSQLARYSGGVMGAVMELAL